MKMKIQTLTGIPAVDLALDTIKNNKQALVFVNTKRGAEKCAEDIARKIKGFGRTDFEEIVLKALPKPTKQCERLSKVIRKGIAFHHAGLVQKQRSLIEDEFRKGAIKIICCTPTLAAGVDLPAFRTIIRDLKRFGRQGLNWIPVLEYQQQAGRAGRPSYDKFGEAICVAVSKGEKQKIQENYINGEAEEIYSKLAVEPVLRTYLLSLIAANFINSEEEIKRFFSKTFWAYQFKDMDRLFFIINKMLDLLQKWEFIKRSDFMSADKVGNDNISATAAGKRVAELYLDPLTAFHIIQCLKMAKKRDTNEFSFLQMICQSLEMRPLLRVKTKEWEDIQEFLNEHEGYLLVNEPSLYEGEYETFLNSVKTANMLFDWIQEKDEEYLMENFAVRPGELRVKIEISDWLLYSSGELARIKGYRSLQSELSKVRIRLKYGVKEELLPLLKFKNIGRVRGRKLYKNNIKDLGDVKKASITTLVQILGKKIAIDVKKQVGEDFGEVDAPALKGQVKLGDFS